MVLTEFTTRKVYYAFPVFVLAYRDEQFGVNITACSSSYSLGQMLLFGLSNDTNAAAQIQKYGECSLNILTADQLPLIEVAGFLHNREKVRRSNTAYHLVDGIPVLDDAIFAETLHVDQIHTFGDYINFTAAITHRFAQEQLLDTKGNLIQDALTPVLYAGDGRKRIYRFLNDEVTRNGSYLRQAKLAPETKLI